jgi:hypothetical protein
MDNWIEFKNQKPLAFEESATFDAKVTSTILLTDGKGQYWADKVIISKSTDNYHGQSDSRKPVAWMEIPRYKEQCSCEVFCEHWLNSGNDIEAQLSAPNECKAFKKGDPLY